MYVYIYEVDPHYFLILYLQIYQLAKIYLFSQINYCSTFSHVDMHRAPKSSSCSPHACAQLRSNKVTLFSCFSVTRG